MKPPSNGASSSISPSSFERRNAPFSAQLRERQVPARCGFARTRIGNPRPFPRKSGSQPTLRWREQDSSPRSPGRERRSRFGEREPGNGDDKRLSRDSEYLKRDRTALLELPHPCGSALRG